MLFGYVIEKTDATLNYIKGHTKRFKNSPLMVNFKQPIGFFNGEKAVFVNTVAQCRSVRR